MIRGRIKMAENNIKTEIKAEVFIPDEDRKKIYSETIKDLLTRELSNSEAFDKAILSLSSALLGISLAFIKDIIQAGATCNKEYLYYSWYLFAAAIVLTLISFMMSNLGIKRHLKYAQRYYLEGKAEYLEKRSIYARLTDFANILSGISFILAIIFTVSFVTLNI
jgi:hypothetical protein